MHHSPFLLRKIFFDAIGKLKYNFPLFIVGLFIFFVIDYITDWQVVPWIMIELGLPTPTRNTLYLIAGIGTITTLPVICGLFNTSLASAQDKKIQPANFFCQAKTSFRLIISMLLYAFLTLGWIAITRYTTIATRTITAGDASAIYTVALLLWGFLGIYLAVIFSQFPYLILDKDAGIFEAFRKSVVITKFSRTKIALFFFLSICINYIGLRAMMVGLFFTIPLTLTTWALIYCTLIHAYEHPTKSQGHGQPHSGKNK